MVHVIFFSQDKIRMGSVLMSLVTVEQQFISDLFFLHCFCDRIGHQADRILFPKLVGNNEAIEQILDRG